MSLHGAPTLNPTGEFPPDTYRSRGYSYCQEHGIHPSASVRVREYELAGPSAPTPASSQYGRDIDNGKKDKGRKGGGGVTQIMTCGAGLFSDGYLNGVIGPVNTILMRMYPHEYAHSVASQNVSSISFLGTVLGQLAFGFLVDLHSRKLGMLLSSGLLIVFSLLCASAYVVGGGVHGMLAALTAYRFFLGVGIGGEYPSGSVACAEATEERKSGSRNRWFVVFTNFSINLGFMVSGLVPLLLLQIFPEKGSDDPHSEYVKRLEPVWRLLLGLGAIFPTLILLLRYKMKENATFANNALRQIKDVPDSTASRRPPQVPFKLILRYYWRPLLTVSVVWFLYDFGSYAFGIYGSYIVDAATRSQSADEGAAPLFTVFCWTSLLLFLNLPGSLLGAFGSDWLGCQRAMLLGSTVQAVVGCIIAHFFTQLKTNMAAFVVLYGLFLSCGEFGAGDNVGLLAAKCCATPVRGRCYGVAAAIGKVGAGVGSWVFPLIVGRSGVGADGGSGDAGMKRAFWIASAMCLTAGVLGMWGVRRIGQDMVAEEDERFRKLLEAEGFVFGDGDGDEEAEK